MPRWIALERVDYWPLRKGVIRMGNRRLRRVLCAIGLACGIPLFVLALSWHFPPESVPARFGTMNVAMTLLFIPLIAGASRGFGGILGTFLTQKPLLYIGHISYGIYIFHFPVQWALSSNKVSHVLNMLPWQTPRFPLVALTTIALAAVSWAFYEKPLNQLKRFFPYRAKSAIGTPSLLEEQVGLSA